MPLIRSLVAAALVAAIPLPAAASAPMGVWAMLDQVRIVQAKGKAPELVLEGTFITREGRDGKPGRLAYTCAEADPTPCLTAWIDLTKAARDSKCAGWGQPSSPLPTPTPLDKPTPEAKPWPVGMGVATSSWRCNALSRPE